MSSFLQLDLTHVYRGFCTTHLFPRKRTPCLRCPPASRDPVSSALILTAFQFMCSDLYMPQIQTCPISRSCGHKGVVKQQASENLQAFPVRLKYATHVLHCLPPTTSSPLQHHCWSGPMLSAAKQMRFIASLSLACPEATRMVRA